MRQRVGGDGRCDHHFDELALEDFGGGGGVEFTVEGDDAAEGRGGVHREGAVVGRHQVGRHGHAAGVGVLDDDAGRGVEGLHAFQRGVGVGQVVVREFLALQEARGGDDALRRIALQVERAALVRVFAVTQRGRQAQREIEGVRPGFGRFRIGRARRQPLGDLAVVGAGVGVGLGGEAAALRERGAAGLQCFEQRGVIGRIHHHAGAGVVLGGGAQHGRAADVDVLDGVVIAAAGLGHGGFERVEVHHQQVDGRDAVLRHHRVVHAVAAEQAAVDLRVQGFHPAVHDFREAGDVADVGDRDAGLAQGLGGATGGQQVHAQGGQAARQVHYAGLVGYGKQGAADRLAVGGHRAPRGEAPIIPSAGRAGSEQLPRSRGWRKATQRLPGKLI